MQCCHNVVTMLSRTWARHHPSLCWCLSRPVPGLWLGPGARGSPARKCGTSSAHRSADSDDGIITCCHVSQADRETADTTVPKESKRLLRKIYQSRRQSFVANVEMDTLWNYHNYTTEDRREKIMGWNLPVSRKFLPSSMGSCLSSDDWCQALKLCMVAKNEYQMAEL